MTVDDPVPIVPARCILLRNLQTATLTHVVSGPAPWRLLGKHNGTGEPMLWSKDAHFELGEPVPAANSFDIVGIDIGDAPNSFAPFTGAVFSEPGEAL